MLHGVIMSGGSGTRFWPLSRAAWPKQFLKFGSDRTLLQATADRCHPLIPAERQWVVTNRVQAAETQNQLPGLPASHLLVEPRGRNTAPCVGLAAAHLLRVDPDAVMAVMPADHSIHPAEQFRAALSGAEALVVEDPQRLVLFGVRPNFPATGFGYLESGAPLTQPGAFRVVSFREKPVHDVAVQYLHAGNYFWNCGIFVWRAQTILDALAQFEPELHAGLMRIADHIGSADYDAVLEREFPQLKAISIDYAVLERAGGVCAIEAPYEWDDVGSWESMARLESSDAAGNTVSGTHCGLETRGCIIHSTPGHLIATVDVEDLLIVHTPNATLVTRRGDEQALRRIIEELKARGLGEYL